MNSNKIVKGTTPTADESKKILGQMQKIVGLTEEQINGLVKNKAQFEKLHVGGKTCSAEEELETR